MSKSLHKKTKIYLLKHFVLFKKVHDRLINNRGSDELFIGEIS